jgi:hypothetical protein
MRLLVAPASELHSAACPTAAHSSPAQELIYAATALRAEFHRAKVQATDPQYESSRAIFESAAKAYEELAGKLTRIAESLAYFG